MTARAVQNRLLTGTNSAGYMLIFLLLIGSITDIQGVAILPLLSKMQAALNLSAAQTSWALNSLSIGTVVLVGLSARYADIVGHRKVLLPLMTLGVVGSALCATATSFGILLTGRIVLGLAVAAPMAWAMVKTRTDEKGMEKAAHYNGTVVSVMAPVGLILGGVLLNAGASWNASFWIVAAGYVVLLVMVVLAPETPAGDRVHVRLDWSGSLGLGAWLVCFLLALSNGQTWGWSSKPVIGLFVAGVALLGAWVWQQRTTSHALMDFKGMDKRQVIAGYSIYCVVAMTSSALYILEPAFAETPGVFGYGFGASVFQASLVLLVVFPAGLLAAAISKPMLANHGPRPPIVVGGALVVMSFVGMALMHTAIWQFYLWVAIYGLGLVLALNIGWALTASAGRQDNMSTTFGIQYALAIPAGALMSAIILASFAADSTHLGPVAIPKEGAYTGLFLLLAIVSLVGYCLNGAFVVPANIRHQGARPAELAAPDLVSVAFAEAPQTVPAAQAIVMR